MILFLFTIKKRGAKEKAKERVHADEGVWMLVSHPVASWPVGAPPPLLFAQST